jgi:hypothetical protein
MARIVGAPVTGEECGEDIADGNSGPKLCLHMAYHLVHRRVGLYVEELRHVEGSDLGDARNVVAQQIHDHAVFGLRLDVVAHRLDDGRIL